MDCGRERPCYWAKTDRAICTNCNHIRHAQVCLGCGEIRVALRRVEGGILCQTCDIKQGNTTGPCQGCGQTAPLTSGICAGCKLHARIDQLAAGAEPDVAVTLAPFLEQLARSENPSSTIRWLYTPGFEITRRILDGEIPISHHGLDQAAVDAPKPVAFLRAKLVDSGVLEQRDEASAQFAAWHATAVLQIAAGPDRAHVRAYATWHVAHQLAQTVKRRGEASHPSVKYAHSLVTEAIKLALWLHDQQLELSDLHQDLTDQWIASGSTIRRRVRLFLAWLRRANVTGPLEVDWDDHPATRAAIDDEQRFRILRRLLHERDLDLRDRFAGSVLLLYGKPTTQIAALRTTDIHTTPEDGVTLRLGRGEIPLPNHSLRSHKRCATGSYNGPGRTAG
jgi:hypothetical protein